MTGDVVAALTPVLYRSKRVERTLLSVAFDLSPGSEGDPEIPSKNASQFHAIGCNLFLGSNFR